MPDDAGGMILPTGWQAVELMASPQWLTPVSQTFHGRDIFAPVAAALASGVPPVELGRIRKSITVIPSSRPRVDDGAVQGEVIHVDHFGNLITDIPAAYLPDKFTVMVHGGAIDGPQYSYDSPEPIVALIGSNGLLEIAAPNGSAARLIRPAWENR